MQLAAPATLFAGAAAFFLPKMDFRPASWAMALLAVLVAFAVCCPPTEFAVPATAFMVFAALPEAPQGGNPVAPPASIGDAPATPATPAEPPAPAATRSEE